MCGVSLSPGSCRHELLQNYHKKTMEELHLLEEDIKATKQAEEQAMVTILTSCQPITLNLGHLQTSSKNSDS